MELQQENAELRMLLASSRQANSIYMQSAHHEAQLGQSFAACQQILAALTPDNAGSPTTQLATAHPELHAPMASSSPGPLTQAAAPEAAESADVQPAQAAAEVLPAPCEPIRTRPAAEGPPASPSAAFPSRDAASAHTTTLLQHEQDDIGPPPAMPSSAHSPITSVAIAADTHVANKTPSTGMPACERICGFTTTTYAMVMNVVSPASNSWRTVVRSLYRFIAAFASLKRLNQASRGTSPLTR